MRSLFIIMLIQCVWRTMNALHMIRYYGAKEDAIKMIEPAESSDQNPLIVDDPLYRQLICDRVITATQYLIRHRSSHQKFPPESVLEPPANPDEYNIQILESTSSNSTSDGLRFTQRLIHAGKFHNQIILARVIECIRREERNWFVAICRHRYGERLLLIEPWELNDSMLIPTALLEPGCDYNVNFPNSEGLDRLLLYFIKQITSDNVDFLENTQKIPDKMTLCYITFNEHARLCGAAFHTLSQPVRGHEYFRTHLRPINYIKLREQRCMKKWISVTEKHSIPGSVVPCVLNRDHQLSEFFILADCKVPHAVFIFIKLSSYTHKLKLIARLDRISVLMDFAVKVQ